MKMWPNMALKQYMMTSLMTLVTSQPEVKKHSLFRPEQVIFSSPYNITKLLVPVNGRKFVNTDIGYIPSVFFTVADPKAEGGSSIYVLEGLAPYEVLEGGRDSTSDFSNDNDVYFGTRDGVYKYDHDSLSAKKYGPFRDDIIQIQKANGTEAIYFLTGNRKMYVLEKNGTVRTKLDNVKCAEEFVLDLSTNLYYVDCVSRMIHIITANGTTVNLVANIPEDFEDIKLLRPSTILNDCIPFFADGYLHILYPNGVSIKKDFYIEERPTAFSVDAGLYLAVAYEGKIYEYNVMEDMFKTMFGSGSHMSRNVSRLVMAVIDNLI